MNEYRVKVSIRNNLILKAIEDQGFECQSDFAKSIGMMPQTLSNLIAFRKSPINSNGTFCVEAMQVMEGLGACPTDLWTEEQLTLSLKRNSREVSIGAKQLNEIQNRMSGNFIEHDPTEKTNNSLVSNKVREILEGLTPREKKVLILRFGIDGGKEHTCEEIAEMFDLTRERIRQIEVKALRKMKNPSFDFRKQLEALL
jgi:RNA polymerase sigma factor (sigma-70 family)